MNECSANTTLKSKLMNNKNRIHTNYIEIT